MGHFSASLFCFVCLFVCLLVCLFFYLSEFSVTSFQVSSLLPFAKKQTNKQRVRPPFYFYMYKVKYCSYVVPEPCTEFLLLYIILAAENQDQFMTSRHSNSPRHFFLSLLSNSKPGKHLQWYPPGVLMQSWLQPPFPLEHSFMSKTK